MTDEMIEGLAAKGGVVNINFFGGFIGPDPATGKVHRMLPKPEVYRDPYDRIAYPTKEPGPPLSRLIDHFNHALKIAGPDHVGIGSDFDGVTQLPVGVEDISKLPAVTAGLLEAGHSERTVRKVLGLNNLRVFKEAMG
jgi:membrane dipeptidase